MIAGAANPIGRGGAGPKAARGSTVYFVTAYRHNHLDRQRPIDPRIVGSSRDVRFYLVDRKGVPPDFRGEALAEVDLDPSLQGPGKTQLAEWTFFVAEQKYRFANYPFFVTSTRFYEKNERLSGSLEDYWDDLFDLLSVYGCGYLPSYNRDFGYEDIRHYFKENFLATTREGVRMLEEIYGVDFLRQRYVSDFWCNYIGFNTRADFDWYMAGLKPLFDFFFDENYSPRVRVEDYIQRQGKLHTAGFRNEKPFSLLIELASHLPFQLEDRPFVGLSYDGFYEVDETRQTGRLIRLPPKSVQSSF